MQVKPNSETLSRGRTPLQSSLYSKLPNKRVVLTYLLQPETTSRKSVISKPRMLFRCGYESSKLAIQFLNFNRNVLLSAKMYPKPFQLIWKRFEFSKILGEAGFENK